MVKRPVAQQVIDGQRMAPEAPDGQDRAVHGQRRDDRVDPRAIGQPRIDHRRGLVDSAADAGYNPPNHVEQVRVVLESHLGWIQLAFALDVNLARPVDQDVADGVVAQQRLQRAQAEDFVLHLFDQLRSIAVGYQTALLLQVIGDRGAQAAVHRGRVERLQLGDVNGLQQMFVNLALEFAERRRFAGIGNFAPWRNQRQRVSRRRDAAVDLVG